MSRKSYAEKKQEAAEADYDEVFSKALTLLEFRPRSYRELVDALKKKGYPEEHCRDSADRLAELGYINDGQFARDIVRSKLRQGHGSVGIRYEMRKRGVPDDIASEALDEIGEDDELASAMPLAEKFYRKYSEKPDRERSEKTAAALVRRGFRASTAFRAVRALGDSELEEEF